MRILYVEDEPFLGKIVKESLESRQFEVHWVTDGAEVMSAFERVRALVDASEGRVTRAARSRLTGGMSTTASSSTK